MTVVQNTTSPITPEDRSKMEKLRELVKEDLSDYYNTDFNLLRWLQGHNTLPIEEIARKLKHHLNLRNGWNLDDLHRRERNHPIHKHWKYGITGPSGVIDNVIVNIEQTYSILEVMKARMVDLEQMLHHVMKLEAETGKQAWILYVMDLTGLQYNKKLYDLVTGSMKSLADFMADHYVEMIKYFVPVCIPSFATALYVVVRPLLPEKTREKVRLVGESNWRNDVLEYAVHSSLPSIWNDNSHTFGGFIELPVEYPVDWYYSSRDDNSVKNFETVTVSCGQAHVVTKELKCGARLKWWVRGNRNFGFGVFWSETKNVEDFFVAKQVSPCFPWMPGPTLVPMEEEVIIKHDAFYHIWVSNERSWWRSLEVQLHVEVSD